MKKKSKLFISTISAFVICCNSNAQVGINTLTPYVNSVFHIDAKGNNTSSTAITSAQASDDIVINSMGNVGIGTVDPTTSLHIKATESTSLKAIRIADGSEGANRYLYSDSDGRVTWKPKPTPQGIVYYTRAITTLPKNVFTAVPVEINSAGNTQIVIPNAGNFIITVRWWGSIISTTNLGEYFISQGDLELRRNRLGVISTIDATSVYYAVPKNGTTPVLTFTVSLFANELESGDILTVYVKPVDYQWELGVGLRPDQQQQTIYYPSIMVYNI